MPLLLDTSVAIELLDDVERTVRRTAEIDGQFLSVVSWLELEAGVYRDESSAARRRRLNGFLKEVEILDFTGAEVAAYSEIIRSSGFSRRLVSDRMIAATAITHGVTIATLNARDLRSIAGLQIEDWSV